MNIKANFFFDKASAWQAEYQKLREIVLSCNLLEDVKWGCPCYTLNNANIVLIHGFKDYCALLFTKGVLLPDEAKLLVKQTPNVQSARQLRFKNMSEINALEDEIKTYIQQAIAVEKSGLKPNLKSVEAIEVVAEFQVVLDQDADLKRAFEALTPGRQKAYLLHFSQAKKSETRSARVQKSLAAILDGKGLQDV